MTYNVSPYYQRIKISELVEEAYSIIGVIAPGETLSAADMATAHRNFRMVLASLSNDGLILNTIAQVCLFMEAGRTTYGITDLEVDDVAIGDRNVIMLTQDLVFQTTLSETAASGETTLTIAETPPEFAGIGGYPNQGMLQIDGLDSLFYCVVDSISDDTVTLNAAYPLPDTASSGNTIFLHGTGSFASTPAPVRILDATSVLPSGEEIPIPVVAREDYMSLPDKKVRGVTTQIYYQRILQEVRPTGTIYVWPTADSPLNRLMLTCEMPFLIGFDVDSPWYRTYISTESNQYLYLLWAFADQLASRYSVPLQIQNYIAQRTREERAKFLSFDQEVGSLFFRPSIRPGQRR